ncbi:hypothetical protein [Limnobacter sp. P1]|uniref:hypothetical protein n=1 Tax=Limnobacter olei TaxID=3031298 RepID=UPI0023B1422A|nr:hypothetical protein [Limnobacter sp. P1]
MRLRCAFCGKLTVPFVMIGTEAVGPKCAKRAGLNRKTMAGTKVQFVKTLSQSQLHPRTLPLFADLEDQIVCGCGHTFDANLGKYGCPNCEGDRAV